MIFRLLLPGLLLTSCIDDHLQKILDGKIKGEINPAVGAPLVEFQIKLGDILSNQSVIHTDSTDLSLKIAFREDSLIHQKISDVLTIPDQNINPPSTQIGAIKINNFTLNRSLSLSEILPSLDSATRRALFVADSIGAQVPFPNIPLQSGGSYNLPSVNNFQSVQLNSGLLKIGLTNQWNTNITKLVFRILDPNNVSVGSIRFQSIASGTTQVDSLNLAGKTLGTALRFSLDSIQVAGSNTPVTVSLGQALVLDVQGLQMEANSATAMIPQQVLSNDTNYIDFQFDNNEELYEIKLDSGSLNLAINTSIPIHLACRLQIPAIINTMGQGLDVSFNIIGNQSNILQIPLNNKIIDLRQGTNGFNQFRVIISKTILPSVGQVTINQSDSLDFAYAIQGIKINYAKGNLGSRIIQADTSSVNLDLNFLDDFLGTISWENPQIQFNILNSFGVPANLNLNLTGYKTGQSPVNLSILNQTIASPVQMGNSAPTIISLNRNNSNLAQLLNMRPDSIVSWGNLSLNPAGLVDTNFVTRESALLMGMEAEIPMEFRINGLTFEDTSEVTFDNLEEIRSAYLVLRTENRFPLGIRAEIGFYRNNLGLMQSFAFPILQAAQVDNQGRVNVPGFTTTPIGLNALEIEKLSLADYMVTKLILETSQGGTQTVKLYSDYSIRMKLGLETQINLKFNE